MTDERDKSLEVSILFTHSITQRDQVPNCSLKGQQKILKKNDNRVFV